MFDAIAFEVMLVVAVVTVTNGLGLAGQDLLGPRLSRRGLSYPLDAPAGDAPAAFVARVRRRERTAYFGSAVAAALGAVGAFVAGLTLGAYLLILIGAHLGRVLVLVLMDAGDARDPAVGPRRATGGRALLEFVPPAGLALMAATQAVVTVLLTVVAYLWAPDAFSMIAAVVAAATALFVVAGLAALWLAHQPLRATSVAERGWADATRRYDIVMLLTVGPVASLAAFAVGDGPGRALPLWLGLLMLGAILLAVRQVDRLSVPLVVHRQTQDDFSA